MCKNCDMDKNSSMLHVHFLVLRTSFSSGDPVHPQGSAGTSTWIQSRWRKLPQGRWFNVVYMDPICPSALGVPVPSPFLTSESTVCIQSPALTQTSLSPSLSVCLGPIRAASVSSSMSAMVISKKMKNQSKARTLNDGQQSAV